MSAPSHHRCESFSLVAAVGGYSLSSCSVQASRCGELDAGASITESTGSKAHGLQQLQHVGAVIVAPGLQSIDSVVVAPGLQNTGSVYVAHGLNYSKACGSSQIRDQTCLLHWQVDSWPLSHERSPCVYVFVLTSWLCRMWDQPPGPPEKSHTLEVLIASLLAGVSRSSRILWGSDLESAIL